jgi:putative peptide zinc metalloprotease protein
MSTSSTVRPLPLRMRPDLVIRPIWHGARRYWVVKDPLAIRFYHLRDEEHAVLEMLDGRHSLADVQRQFERRFAPHRISPEQLQSFLGMLHREGLVLADGPRQADELLARAARARRRAFWQALASPLAIRFRGIDPTRLVNWLYDDFRWLFSPGYLALVALLALAALVLCAVQFETLVARLPDFRGFFHVHNLIALAAVMVVVKVLHELGHALACRHFGGHCHELGLMLLIFTPCLYCNVSDAWLMESKWRRIAVSAAGMYVELILASLATFGWWFSQPGLLNSLCLDVMFVCSVSTVMFNGNPLLRYDGYFILTDLVEVPNLREQSTAVVRHWLAAWFAGVRVAPERMLPQRGRGWLAAYWAASTAYRWFVTILILWVLHETLEPHGLAVLVALLAIAIVVGAAASVVVRAARFLRQPSRSRQVKPFRLLARCALVAALVGVGGFVPLPHRVDAPAWIAAQSARSVYVVVPGTLTTAVREGDEVSADALLAQLANLEIDREVEKLAGQVETQRRRIDNLFRRQQAGDAVATAELPTAREALADLKARLAQRRADQGRLTLRSPVAGTVLAPPRKTDRPAEGELATWTGTPLEERNRGTLLEQGVLVCQIGDPGRQEAVLVIDQADIDFVRVGQQVRLRLNQLSRQFLFGEIVEIAELDMDLVPRELLGEKQLATRTDQAGQVRPLSTGYQARVRLDKHGELLSIGATGLAKVEVERQTLARLLYRYLRRTLRLEL